MSYYLFFRTVLLRISRCSILSQLNLAYFLCYHCYKEDNKAAGLFTENMIIPTQNNMRENEKNSIRKPVDKYHRNQMF